MGPNKTDKAVENASRASGGQQKISENFDAQVNRVKPLSLHSHRSAAADDSKVLLDLHILKPSTNEPSRMFSFPELDKWLACHKKNLLFDAPLEHDEEEDF